MEYISPRRIHIRRLIDIVMGSAINGAKTKLQKLALGRTFDISRGQTDFNKSIRANTPSIYLVDPDLIAIEIDEYFSEFQGRTNVKDLGDLIRSVIIQSYPKLDFDVIEGYVTDIHSKLIDDLKNTEEAGKSYLTYRRNAAAAGSELRRLLNKHKISILTNADKMISNIGNRIPFVTYTFDASKDINKIVQSAVQGYYKNKLKVFVEEVTVGNVVNAGHVGLYGNGSFLGINMPSALISGVATRKFEDIEQELGNIAHHVDYGIQINPDYSKSGMFLDLTFNFTVSMPAELNTKELNYAEARAIKKAAGSIVISELERGIKEQLTKGSILGLISESSASPNFKEYIANSLIGILQGIPVQPVKHTATAKGSSNLPEGSSLSNRSPTSPKISGSGISIPRSTLRNKQGQFSSLINIQNLLNQTLAEQIHKNMGTGLNRSILNYRSGRFADSAVVERMSQSREGMLTAYYTYMKYPYQTFEPGFAQGSPSTRDPKLLISKSIREIASTLVGNRMRAVSV